MLTNPDEAIKGDFTAIPKGFESYVEKAQRGQDIMEVFTLALSNAATAQFTKVLAFLREICASRDLDPNQFFPTDAELTEKAEEMAKLLPEVRAMQQPQQPQLPAPILNFRPRW
jgi:hypothetical protein